MKMNRIIAASLAVVLCFGALAGCGGSKGDDVIKLGVLAPLTGDVAVYGNAVNNAVKLYVEEINKAGGVAGKQVEIITYDEKGDATEAVTAYNKLVSSDEVHAIIGSVTSTPSIAVAQASVEDNIPILTPTGTHQDITTYGKNYFRACFLDPFQGSTMAKYASEVLKAKTAGIIYNTSDAYSTGLMQSFTDTAKELGLEVVATEGYAANDVDFKAQLTNIQGKNPDVLFCPDYYNTVYLIATQVKEIGVRATLLGVDGVDGILDVATDKSILEGLIFCNHYSTADESPLVQNFLKNYQAKYNETPNALAALGYDGTMIMLDAIGKVIESGTKLDTSEECRNAIIAQLEKTDIDAVTGHIVYDEMHNPQKSCAIIKIENGEYTLLTKY